MSCHRRCPSGDARSLTRRFASQEAMLAVAVIGLAIVVGFVNPRFLSANNLADILLGNAYVAVAAIGMSMVIISGNIDISVGALIGVLATDQRLAGGRRLRPIAIAWVAPLVLGVAVMALQGAVVAYLGIPAIVVTLGMLSILKGGLISVTGGKWITDLPDNFHLADIELFGVVPMPVAIMVAATLLAAAWMRFWPARPGDLRDRRQPRGGAAFRRVAAANDRHGVRAARLLRRRRRAACSRRNCGSSNRPRRPISN